VKHADSASAPEGVGGIIKGMRFETMAIRVGQEPDPFS